MYNILFVIKFLHRLLFFLINLVPHLFIVFCCTEDKQTYETNNEMNMYNYLGL